MRRILYIDGSNLYGGMSEILRAGEYFDFVALIEAIEQTSGNFDAIKFYGTYRQEKASDSAARQYQIVTQRLFFTMAHDHPKVTFVKGYLSSKGKEKGIDMKMGVDMVHDAHLDSYDEATVMSGDDDFIYAILTARKIGKLVNLVALGTRYPHGAAHYVASRIVLDMDEIFVRNKLSSVHDPDGISIIELRNKIPLRKAIRKTRRS